MSRILSTFAPSRISPLGAIFSSFSVDMAHLPLFSSSGGSGYGGTLLRLVPPHQALAPEPPEHCCTRGAYGCPPNAAFLPGISPLAAARAPLRNLSTASKISCPYNSIFRSPIPGILALPSASAAAANKAPPASYRASR